jgi:hypothetical protein
MFGYQFPINDRYRLINLVNDGTWGEKYVSKMKKDDVLVFRFQPDEFEINTNPKFSVGIVSVKEIKKYVQNDKSFKNIHKNVTSNAITLYIVFEFENTPSQMSTINVPKEFFYTNDMVIGQMDEECTLYTEKVLLDQFKALDIKHTPKDNNIVMVVNEINKNEAIIYNLPKDIAQTYFDKRFIDIDASNSKLQAVYIVQDGYRFHGVAINKKPKYKIGKNGYVVVKFVKK